MDVLASNFTNRENIVLFAYLGIKCHKLLDYDGNSERVIAEEEYELPEDVYDTKGLFDDGYEGKQDNEGMLDDYDEFIRNTSEL